MPNLDVFDLGRKKVGSIDLSDAVFGAESRPHLYHQVVRAQLLSKRAGTSKTKKRGEVSGSTRKVYRQKGTGRARHGDSRSPLFKRGGTVFGPIPKEWDVKVPKKVKRAALVSALSDRVREGHVWILDKAELEQAKTKRIAELMARFEVGSVLFVDVDNRNLSLSCRNLPTAKYLSSRGLNLFDVLKYDHLILTKGAVEAIEGALTT
ncbi:MAG: 50S ribosomal protein L4 [Myxococcota bacterium]|jgi:large subunit ribosomal protein L4|nr:50S ribosomal protein L4 [Myxococcota bacterium]HHW96965.1 50S ribosomal protein L4 [Oligoflexales bacterium]MBP8970307.1 50S ribosomal protein L4 [Myxococcota bacterium]HON26429.1 50S ribosomal protein L4 [Myxococcota bacterium]HOS61636.1 50S ribosomal protein L4 [Myxococcota bacterium]